MKCHEMPLSDSIDFIRLRGTLFPPQRRGSQLRPNRNGKTTPTRLGRVLRPKVDGRLARLIDNLHELTFVERKENVVSLEC